MPAAPSNRRSPIVRASLADLPARLRIFGRLRAGAPVGEGSPRRRGRRGRDLNKTSIIPAVYGEPFVKRHGLFCLAVASRHGVVPGCVSRQDHDRSAVYQLDQNRSGRRAGRSDTVAGAGLADFRSFRRRSRRRRRRAADAAGRPVAAGAPGHGRGVFAQPRRAGRHRAGAVARPAVGRAADPRTFTASDRRRSRRHRRDRQ